MGTTGGRWSTYREGIRETAPTLTEAQVEAVFALWEYGLREYGREEKELKLRSYLLGHTEGTDVEKREAAKRITGCLWSLGTCLF